MDQTAKRKGEIKMTEVDDIELEHRFTKNYAPLSCASVASIGADTALQIASAHTVKTASEIAMQQAVIRQQELISATMTDAVLSVHQKMVLESIRQQEEMMRSIQPQPYWIDSLKFAKTITCEPQIDEEITIKKSQWNSLQEELADSKKENKERKDEIAQIGKKIEELKEEFKTFKTKETTLKRIEDKLDEIRKSSEKFAFLEEFADIVKEIAKQRGVNLDKRD
jgi:hypothetical protein